jgi:hypothetical protein
MDAKLELIKKAKVSLRDLVNALVDLEENDLSLLHIVVDKTTLTRVLDLLYNSLGEEEWNIESINY